MAAFSGVCRPAGSFAGLGSSGNTRSHAWPFCFHLGLQGLQHEGSSWPLCAQAALGFSVCQEGERLEHRDYYSARVPAEGNGTTTRIELIRTAGLIHAGTLEDGARQGPDWGGDSPEDRSGVWEVARVAPYWKQMRPVARKDGKNPGQVRAVFLGLALHPTKGRSQIPPALSLAPEEGRCPPIGANSSWDRTKRNHTSPVPGKAGFDDT